MWAMFSAVIYFMNGMALSDPQLVYFAVAGSQGAVCCSMGLTLIEFLHGFFCVWLLFSFLAFSAESFVNQCMKSWSISSTLLPSTFSMISRDER